MKAPLIEFWNTRLNFCYLPEFIFWLIAPLYDRTRRYVSKNVGIRIQFDNAYSKRDMHMSYLPIEQTIKEHFQQILDDGLLDKN